MLIKNIQVRSVLVLIACVSLTGCTSKNLYNNKVEISEQSPDTILLTSAQPNAGNSQSVFPSKIKEEHGKVYFDASIITGDGIDLTKLTVKPVNFKTINRDAVFNRLFQNIEIVRSQKGESGGADSYEGSKEETLIITSGGINFFSDKARPVLRAFDVSKRSDRYNVDKYKANTAFDFSTREAALNNIISELAGFGIDLGQRYDYNCYALDYNTMMSEEYAVNHDGKELKSIYKKDWSSDDNCYYFCIWQTSEDLPVIYSSREAIKGEDAPIHAIYSKRGIEFLTTRMSIGFEQGGSAVQLASVNDIVACVSNKYNPIITNSTFTVNQMEMVYNLQMDYQNNYFLSPAWLLDIKAKDNADNSEYGLQMMIDAQTAKEIIE